ncbi:FHA domain-containing protein [Clostridium fallax]|uniref:FHA domain protein n=1 Tax=Clostridium fallax TaxID=1533 RepID=A0A1M4VLV6_9CLOT|nr:FHA domain-containing protein [Clostridium fallax]SHE69847.1 FHA domain protein [Clostridium fallax]SQB22783.1 FHA-domain containing secreted protein [Clostridium fallax]
MNFTKLMSGIFTIFFAIILYAIIYYALRIMYKDVKGGKKKKVVKNRKVHGLEVISAGESQNLKSGSVIPVRETITIGRREENSIVIQDKFVSGSHAKVYVKNDEFYLEDLNSTNGTFLNNNQVKGKVKLKVNDEIRLGSTILKVID